jgi:hypothetical protein
MFVNKAFKVKINGINIVSLVKNLIIYLVTQLKYTEERGGLIGVTSLEVVTLQIKTEIFFRLLTQESMSVS